MTTVNSKFASTDIVLANLGRAHKKINWDANDVLEWCMQLETEMVADVDSMVYFKDIPLIVKNHQSRLPCNVHRILHVRSHPDNRHEDYYDDEHSKHHGQDLSYNNNGAYITFDHYNKNHNEEFNHKVVFITYYGTKIDLESGEPLILKTHIKACEAYCVQQVYYEKFLNNEINAQQWRVIDDRVTEGCNLAISQGIRFKDEKDLNYLDMIRGNMLPHLGEGFKRHHAYFLGNQVI